MEDTPVLITAVTDPAESGLVDTNEKPGANVTGTSDLTPVKEQIDLLNTRLFGSRIYVDVEISMDGSKSLTDSHRTAEAVHLAVENAIPEVKHCMV